MPEINEINLPIHLIIPCFIALLIFTWIILRKKKLIYNKKLKWQWISIALFLGVYIFILTSVIYTDISLQIELKKLDLNKDGFFNGDEITTEQKELTQQLIADTGRNLSFITGLVFSGIISLLFFIGAKSIEYLQSKNKSKSNLDTSVGH